jgi:hypothetical protein
VNGRPGIVEGIGAQNAEPVVTRLGFDLLLINRKMMASLNFQIATVAFVSVFPTRLSSLAEIAPLSAQQWPLGRAHPYGRSSSLRQTT